MGVSIDLAKAHASHHYGELTAILTWVNDERALVLLPTYRKGAPWYVVMESAAFKYDNPVYLAHQAKKAAEVMGMADTRDNWFKLATIIHEALPDLIRMPHAPDKELSKATYGSMQLRLDGKLMAGEEIRLEKDTATYGTA